MRLKILAISDTHLGQGTSLLSFPHGLQHLWLTLQDFWTNLFDDFEKPRDNCNPKRETPVEIEEVILLGDIPDRTLSSTSEIYVNTLAFSQMLGSAANIKKAVYIPGNHDHTLWTNYKRVRSGGDGAHSITSPTGDILVKQGKRCDINNSAEELLSTFFGYPLGWAWCGIENQGELDFAIANPLYAKVIGERAYVFTHGTHFRPEVSPKEQKRFSLVDRLKLDKLGAGLEIKPIDGDLRRAESLKDVEKLVAPFVDSLWPSSENESTSRSAELWYLYTLLRGGFDRKRTVPQSEIFTREKLESESQDRISRLTSNGEPIDNSLKRWKQYFLPSMRTYLQDHDLLRDKMTFVYGDTHRGGWGEISLESGEQVRIYNCGSWIVSTTQYENVEEYHPTCHIFVVSDDGKEYLFDVSFVGVKVGKEKLLELAAQDVYNRKVGINPLIEKGLELWHKVQKM